MGSWVREGLTSTANRLWSTLMVALMLVTGDLDGKKIVAMGCW
jgi:hypothetical protein